MAPGSETFSEYGSIEAPDTSYLETDIALESAGIGQENNFEEYLEDSFKAYIKNWLRSNIPNYSSQNIQTNSNPDLFKNESLIGLQVGNKWYFFDFYSQEHIPGQTLQSVREYRENNTPEEIENILTGVPALENLMQSNSQREVRDFLTDDDTASDRFGKWSEMTPKQLQMTIRDNIEIFISKGGVSSLPESERKTLADMFRRYLEVVMGIGEEFEEGADYFYKTEQEIDIYVSATVASFGSLDTSLDYFETIHRKINDNSAINQQNRNAHRVFSQKLSQAIYEMYIQDILSRDNSDSVDGSSNGDKNQREGIAGAIRFIKLLTERTGRMNDLLRDTELAEKLCIEVLQRPGGVIDRLDAQHNLDFSDPKVGNKTPTQVVSATIGKLENIGLADAGVLLINSFGIDKHLIIGENSDKVPLSYEAASFEQKRDISLLARLLEKLNSGEFDSENFSGLSGEQQVQKITDIAVEIQEESFQAVQDAYDDTMGGQYNRFFGENLQSISHLITPEELECFELFGDIRGFGIFNPSDENLNTISGSAKTLGVILGTIAVVMAVTAATGGGLVIAGLLASGGSLTTVGSLTAIGSGATAGTAANLFIFDKRRYDSNGELIWDVGTDFIVNTAHAVYMEKITMAFWKGSSGFGKAGLLGADFGSGIYIEGVREDIISSWFRGKDLLGEQVPSIREVLNSGGFNKYHHDHYARKAGLEDDDTEIQNKLQEITSNFEEAYTLYKAWNHEDLSFENESLFNEWFETHMGGFHRQISKQGTIEFLNLIEQWSEEQIEKYYPEY